MGTERKTRKINIIKRFLKQKAKSKAKSRSQNVREGERKSGLELVNGTRRRRRIIRIVSLSIVAIIVLTVFIINLLTPTGLIELIQNSYSASGRGSFPVGVYSTNALSFGCRNDIVTVVNDTFFEVYNTDGKLIQAASHGMSNPTLEESEARFLLFDRERYGISVFNYGNELYTKQFDKTIISAAIGRDGTYAVATSSDTYKNTVFVYNKDNELVYTWNSASYYVTDVAVSDDGDSIAVSLLNSNAGAFESFIYILNFDSASPKHKYTFNDIVSSITDCGDYLLVNGFDISHTIKYEGGELDLGINGTVRCYDFDFNGNSVMVYGRGDNEQVNTVTVIGENGNIKSSFGFNAAVIDVCINEKNVTLLTPTACYIYDLKGNLKTELPFEYKGLFVGLSEDSEILILDNSKLLKLN